MRPHFRIGVPAVLALVGCTFALAGCSGRPAGNINDPSSVPRPPFGAFKTDLESTLGASTGDLQHHTYHFVLLFNSTRRTGENFQYARNLVHGLLFHYLQKGDLLSVVPYGLTPDLDSSQLAQPFSPEVRPRLYDAIKPPQGDQDGHDDERALLETLEELDKGNSSPSSTIFVLVSDKEVSEPSKTTPHPLMSKAEFEGQLQSRGIQSLFSKSYSDTQSRIWTKVYAPTSLTPLGQLTFARDVPPPPWIFWARAGAVLFVVLVGAGLLYRAWLGRKLGVFVGSEYKTLRYGQTLVIGGPDAVGANVQLKDLPLHRNVAQLEVSPRRQILLRGVDKFQIIGANEGALKITYEARPIEFIERGGGESGTFTLSQARR